MGDRGQIVVTEDDSKVYLYTHWRGESLRLILQRALARGKDRWHDAAYLARIIFCEMLLYEWEAQNKRPWRKEKDSIRLEDVCKDVLNYGISSVPTRPDHHDLIVDTPSGTVKQSLEGWTIEEFVGISL